jgi:hypothetical protein
MKVKLILFFLFILIFLGCGKKKSHQIKFMTPVSYQPHRMGLRNRVNIHYLKDSLFIISKPFTSEDTTIISDYIYSIVEIYDKNDSLLYRFTKSETFKNSVIQELNICPFEADTFTVRSWGFCYIINDNKNTPYDSKKLTFGTTIFGEVKMPKDVPDENVSMTEKMKKEQDSKS